MRPVLAFSLLGLAATAAVAAACSDDNNNPNITPDVTIVSGASTQTTNAFAPNPFTESVAVSGEVIWANGDGVTHRVVSDVPLFDSGNLGNGDTFSFTFTAPGTYTYHCSIHPGMVGSIVINP